MGYASHWDMMGAGMGWLGPFNMLLWPILLIVVIGAIVWLVRRPSVGSRREPAALDALEARYAHGDISRDEYIQKRSDILQTN